MIDSAFLFGRRTERLLSVWCHGFMVVEGLVEALLMANCVGPDLVCIGWNGDIVDVGGELLARGFRWVHRGERDVRHFPVIAELVWRADSSRCEKYRCSIRKSRVATRLA